MIATRHILDDGAVIRTFLLLKEICEFLLAAVAGPAARALAPDLLALAALVAPPDAGPAPQALPSRAVRPLRAGREGNLALRALVPREALARELLGGRRAVVLRVVPAAAAVPALEVADAFPLAERSGRAPGTNARPPAFSGDLVRRHDADAAVLARALAGEVAGGGDEHRSCQLHLHG